MAVKTPQLDVTPYQAMEAPPPPVPEMPTNNPLPTSAGYVSKAGAGAFIASNIINGYLKGRQHAAEVKQQKADQQIKGADYTYKTMADNYNQMLRSGKAETDPDVMKAKEAANAAWQASLSVKGQYVMPQDDKKPKGAKQKTEGFLKGVFGKEGIQPHVIPAAALAALKQAPPPGLGLSLEDKAAMTEQQRAEFDLAQQKKTAGREDTKFAWLEKEETRKQRFDDLAAKDPATLSLGESAELTGLQRIAAADKDPVHGIEDMNLQKKIMRGDHMTQGEMQTAVARGLIQGPHVEQRTTEKGFDELVSYDPVTGTVTGIAPLGKHYVDQTQLSNAMALDKWRQTMQFNEIKRGMGPDATDQQVWAIVAQENAKHPEAMAAFIGDNPVQKAKDIQAVNVALGNVWKEFYDPNTTKSKDPAAKRDHEILENLIETPTENGGTGTYAFRGSVDPTGKKMTSWHMFAPNEYAPTYKGNATPQELQTAAKSLYNRTRQALQTQGKGKYTEADLDRMLPPRLATLAGYGGMPNGPLEKPPSAAASSNRVPTGYNVTINGQTVLHPSDGHVLTPDDIDEAQQQGATIEPVYTAVPNL
jgi:hypothetical protein